MSIEERLKDLILTRYVSIREFTQVADIPYTTLDSIFKRGVANSSVSNIIKICKALNLSVDALADGEIVTRYSNNQAAPPTDVKEIVNEAKSKLAHSDILTIDGHNIDIEIVEPIIEALDIGYEMVKRKSNKQKGTTKTITKTITKTE